MTSPAVAPTAPRPFFSRWPGRLLLAFLTLVVLILLFGPMLASAYARPKIEQAIGEQIHGRAEIAAFSVGWSGAFTLSGLKLTPPGDAPVVEIPGITGQAAVMAALGGDYQVRAEVQQPVVRIRREPDRKTNLDHLLQTSDSAPPGAGVATPSPAGAPLPPLQLDLTVKGGKIIFEDGAQTTQLEQIEFLVALPALDQPGRFEGAFSIAGGGSGKLVARITPAREGRIDPSGSVEYALDGINLERVETAARLFSSVEKLAGHLQARGNYTIGHLPEITGNDEWTLQGLTAAGPALGKDPLAFPEIHLTHRIAIDARRIGKADLTLVSGKAVDAVANVTFGEGESTDAVFKLSSDLKDLGDAIRGILHMKEGVSLDGRMTADGTLKGTGARGTLKATLQIGQLSAIDAAGKKTPIEKQVGIDGDLDYDTAAGSAEIRKLTLESSPVRARAQGTVSRDATSATYEATADLDLLARRLSAFMDLGGTSLAGRIEAKGDATTQGKDIHVKGRTSIANLLIGKTGPINLESTSDATLRFGDDFAIDGAQRTTIADMVMSGRTVKNVVLEVRYKQTGEKIEVFGVTGPGLKLDASGTTARLTGNVDADPGPFYRGLGILFGEFDLDGKPLQGEFTVVSGEAREVEAKLHSAEILLGGKSHKDLAIVLDATLGEVTTLRQARASSSSGFIDAKGTTGRAQTDLKLNAEGDLGSIAILMAVPPHWQLSGKATVSGTMTGTGDAFVVSLDTSVPELEITRRFRSDDSSLSYGSARPVTVRSSGTVNLGDAFAVDLKHKITIMEISREGRSIRNIVVDAALRQTGDTIDSLLVTGPGISLDGAGPLRAFRTKVKIEPGTFDKELAFLFGDFNLSGPPVTGEIFAAMDKTWDVRGQLEGAELTAGNRTFRNVRAEFDLGLTEAIELRKFFLGVAGGSFSATGVMSKTREEFKFQADGELAVLAPDALPKSLEIPGKIFLSGDAAGANDIYDAHVKVQMGDIGLVTEGSNILRGKVGPTLFTADAKLKFAREAVMELTHRLTVDEIHYDGRSVTQVKFGGTAKQVGSRLDSVTLFGPGLKVEGSGAASNLSGKITLEPVAFYNGLASAFGDFGLGGQPLTGAFTIKEVDRARELKGDLATKELIVRKQAQRNVRADYDLTLGDVITIRTAKVSAASGFLEAKGTYADAGADLKLDGEGDLAQMSGLLGLPADARIGGKGVVQGTLTGKEILKAVLGGEIQQFVVEKGGRSVKDPVVSLASEVTVDRTAKTVAFDRGELNSTFLRGTVGGRVLAYDTDMLFENFALNLRYVPDRFGPVLALFLPGDLVGEVEQELNFTLAGKATATELKSVLATRLDAYKYYGILLKGPVEGGLEKGIFSLKAPLTTQNGSINTDALLDLHPVKDNPVSTFASFARDVELNEETSKLLEKVHPIFHLVEGSGRLTGISEFDLTTEWAGPLEAKPDAVQAAERALTGKGRLLVKNLELTGSMFLGTVLQYLGDGNAAEPGEVSCENMIIGQGKVSYDLMRVYLQGTEMKFRGSVYFNQQLDMEMEVPITKRLADKNPGMGKFLGKSMVVPVKGTVANPSIDFAGAIANILKKGLLDKAGGLFKDIFGGGEEEKK